MKAREEVMATAAFLAIAAGCWMAWPPLGLIVPGGIVFASLAWRHLTGKGNETNGTNGGGADA